MDSLFLCKKGNCHLLLFIRAVNICGSSLALWGVVVHSFHTKFHGKTWNLRTI